MSEEKKLPPQSDEIDLGHLFAKISDFFKNLAMWFVRLLALLRNTPLNNRVLFFSLIVLSTSTGFIYFSFLKKRFYESKMILSSEHLNMRIVDSSIDKLNLLAGEISTSGLANELKILDSLAANIVKFEARPFVSETDIIELEVLKEQLKNAQVSNNNAKVIEQVINRIEIENRHAFEFSVRTYNPTIIKPLQEALVNYFRNNEYVRKRIEVTKTMLIQRKAKIDKELPKLDSLKRVIYSNYKNMAEQSRQGSNNVILSDKAVTDPIEIWNKDIALYEQKLDTEKQLYLQPDFEIVDGFTEFSEPSSASLSKVIAIAIAIGLTLGYVMVGLLNLNKYLATIKVN